jgi:hypothetical protein
MATLKTEKKRRNASFIVTGVSIPWLAAAKGPMSYSAKLIGQLYPIEFSGEYLTLDNDYITLVQHCNV